MDTPFPPLNIDAAPKRLERIEEILKDRDFTLRTLSSKTLDLGGISPHTIKTAIMTEVQEVAWQCLCRQQDVKHLFEKYDFLVQFDAMLDRYQRWSIFAAKRSQPLTKPEVSARKMALSYLHRAMKLAEVDET